MPCIGMFVYIFFKRLKRLFTYLMRFINQLTCLYYNFNNVLFLKITISKTTAWSQTKCANKISLYCKRAYKIILRNTGRKYLLLS